jgi:hypothetical protein
LAKVLIQNGIGIYEVPRIAVAGGFAEVRARRVERRGLVLLAISLL